MKFGIGSLSVASITCRLNADTNSINDNTSTRENGLMNERQIGIVNEIIDLMSQTMVKNNVTPDELRKAINFLEETG